MALETHMKLSVTEPDFFLKKKKKKTNWPKKGKNEFYLFTNLVANFLKICSIMKFYIFVMFLHKFHIWEKYRFKNISQMLSANQRARFSSELSKTI